MKTSFLSIVVVLAATSAFAQPPLGDVAAKAKAEKTEKVEDIKRPEDALAILRKNQRTTFLKPIVGLGPRVFVIGTTPPDVQPNFGAADYTINMLLANKEAALTNPAISVSDYLSASRMLQYAVDSRK